MERDRFLVPLEQVPQRWRKNGPLRGSRGSAITAALMVPIALIIRYIPSTVSSTINRFLLFSSLVLVH
jgi:hypothetical protein